MTRLTRRSFLTVSLASMALFALPPADPHRTDGVAHASSPLPVATFMSLFALNNGSFTDLMPSCSNPQMRIHGQGDFTRSNRAYLWVDNATDTRYASADQTTALSAPSGTVTIPNLTPNSTYTVTQCDIYGSAWGTPTNYTTDTSGNLAFTISLGTTPGGSPQPDTAFLITPRAADSTDWNQVGHDAQRTSLSPTTTGVTWNNFYQHAFQPEKLYPAMMPICYNDGLGTTGPKVYFGSEIGNVYAFDQASNTQRWAYQIPTQAPIVNGMAADAGLLFVAAMDGTVYALNSSSGALAWSRNLGGAGFSSSPMLANGKLYVCDRGDAISCLTPSTGAVQWTTNVGCGLLHTPAYDPTNDRVLIGGMDGKLHALNASTGAVAWTTAQLVNNQAFLRWWPVVDVAHGYVVVKTNPAINTYTQTGTGIAPGFPFLPWSGTSNAQWCVTYGPTVAAGQATQVPDFMNAQATVMAGYNANPSNYGPVTYALHLADGSLGPQMPQDSSDISHSSDRNPITICADGTWVLPVHFGGHGNWGRVSPATMRFVDVLYDGLNDLGETHATLTPTTDDWCQVVNGTPTFVPDDQSLGASGDDEQNMVSMATNNAVMVVQQWEDEAQITGTYDLNGRRWHLYTGRAVNQQMRTDTFGGGMAQAAISGNRIFHQFWNNLMVITLT